MVKPFIDSPAFTPFRDQEEIERDKAKRKVLAVSLSKEDQKMIEEMKEVFDTDQESTILKTCARYGADVIHGRSVAWFFKWVQANNRRRAGYWRGRK